MDLLELIDTLWNVNKFLAWMQHGFLLELIDTLWNVNDKSFTKLSMLYSELIDTLWNVNCIVSTAESINSGN